MTRERKMKVMLVLGLTGLTMLFVAGLKRNSDHYKVSKDLKPKTPSICRHRKISSVSPEDNGEDSSVDASLETICANENQLATLKEDLEHLQRERNRVIAALEKYTKESEEEKERQASQVALLSAMMFSMQTPSPQMSIPTPIIMASSPFHNPSTQQLNNYMQMATLNRLSFNMERDNYWNPEWDSQGNLSNSLFGGPSAFQNIESMYRDPLGTGIYSQNPYQTQMPFNQNQIMAPRHQQPTLFFQ
jgi:hypothetical protein